MLIYVRAANVSYIKTRQSLFFICSARAFLLVSHECGLDALAEMPTVLIKSALIANDNNIVSLRPNGYALIVFFFVSPSVVLTE